jgi:thiol-disulfide isomerase/thioredoxin
MFQLTENYTDIVESTEWAVVKFSAPWCSVCKTLDPIFDALQEAFEAVDFYEINLEDLDTVPFANRFDIKSLPTVIMFHYGVLVWRSGKLTEAEYSKKISEGMYYTDANL